MYLIRSSSSACTIAIAPSRAHSSSSVRAEPLSSRIPVCVVVRSVVKNLKVAVPSATASAIEAIVASDGVPVKTGWKAKSAYERGSKIRRRCSTATFASNS